MEQPLGLLFSAMFVVGRDTFYLQSSPIKIAVNVCERFRKVCAVDSLLLARILLEGRFTKIRRIEWLRKRRNLRVVNGPRMT